MAYIFRGNLRAYLCEDCIESLSNVTILLYGLAGAQEPGAAEKAAVLTDEQVQEKGGRLLGQGETDAEGNFTIHLGDQVRYQGGALQVDVRCGSVPRAKRPRRRDPVQFTAATVSPEWSQRPEGSVAEWRHIVSFRLWCFIRGLFDAWVICGRVRDCETRQPVAGLTVLAFDVDWLQDDPLGSAVTGADGRFRIDYSSADFRVTPFSPLINLEHVGGPDVYFRVETSGGQVLLPEPRSRGRKPDRENRGPCFCVELCVESEPTPPYDNPLFTNVGNFHILADIDWSTGLANKAKLGIGGAGWGFTGVLKLRGFCPKKKPGTNDVMFYRFQYEKGGVKTPITGALLEPVLVGSRLIEWDYDGDGTLDWVFQDVMVAGSGGTPDLPPPPAVPPGTPWGAPPVHVVEADAQGWIRVDQRSLDNGFYGPLLALRSASVVPGGASPGAGAGNPVPPAQERRGEKIKLIFETTTNPSSSAATETQVDQPTLLVNNWTEVRELWFTQFSGPGANACTKITSSLNILYTVNHEFVAEWSLGMSSAASPWSAPALPSGTTSANGNVPVNTSGWPPCSYTVSLSSRLKLTDGESNDQGESTPLTFCIC